MCDKDPADSVVLRCEDSVTEKVDIGVLRNSCEHFKEVFNENRIKPDDSHEVDFTGQVMKTVLHYLQKRPKKEIPDFEAAQVIHLLSAAHKFGILDLIDDIKEFIIANPRRCFDSREFLCSHSAEEVALLKPIFSDSRFTGRLLLYQRISEWKRRMWIAGVEESFFRPLDQDFYEKLVDKNILVYLEKFNDPIIYSQRDNSLSEDAPRIFTRLQGVFGSDSVAPTLKLS